MLLPNALTHQFSRILCHMGAAFLALTLVACANVKPHPAADPSLVEIQHNRSFDRVLLGANAQVPQFTRVFLEPTSVTFSDYWLRDRRGDYSERDLERLTRDYGKLLDKSLTEGFEKKGNYQVVSSAAEADVIVRPALESLNIYAPDLSFHGRMDQYIHEAGNATFNVLLVDAKTSQPLAQFIDHRETFNSAGMIREKADRITNARYFSRLMDRWTNNMLDILSNPQSVRVNQ